MPSPFEQAKDLHHLCHAADMPELESEMIRLAQGAGLLSEPVDQQAMATECEELRSALEHLEVQVAGADEELKAELKAEIRLIKEALMVTEIALLSAAQPVATH